LTASSPVFSAMWLPKSRHQGQSTVEALLSTARLTSERGSERQVASTIVSSVDHAQKTPPCSAHLVSGSGTLP